MAMWAVLSSRHQQEPSVYLFSDLTRDDQDFSPYEQREPFTEPMRSFENLVLTC